MEKISLYQLAAVPILLIAALAGCAAPPDYYAETGHMTRLGEETRRATGRNIGEIVHPEEETLHTPIELEGGPTFQVQLVGPGGPAAVETGSAEADPTPPIAPAYAIDGAQLSAVAQSKYGIRIQDVKAILGRLDESSQRASNILRVEFSSPALDESGALRELLLICAIAAGMDENAALDAVVGLALDGGSLPWLSAAATMQSFYAYKNGEMSLSEWKQLVDIQRF